MKKKKPRICLNMIVKNEAPVIERCLASVKDKIDYWVIVDTGSSDGTQEIIRSYLKDIPGELFEKPWVDFAHNRNLALELGRPHGDYLLFIDADQILEFPSNSGWPKLQRDCYYTIVQSDFRYAAQYVLLVKTSLSMRWEGVLHEGLVHNGKDCSVFTDIRINAFSDGNRSLDPEKFLKDAAILEKALETDPTNSRHAIFLALTYDTAQKYELAYQWFEKRSQMGGSDEEIFYSILRMAHLQRLLKKDPEVFIATYERAYAKRPTRAEPLYWLADYYITMQEFEKAYALAKKAEKIPPPYKDIVYLEYSIYDHEILLQIVRCAYQTKRYKECYSALLTLQKNPKLPANIRAQVEDILPHVKDCCSL